VICENCGEDTLHEIDGYAAHSMLLGAIWLQQVQSLKCDDCEETFLDSKNWALVDQLVIQREDEAIGKIPINQFVSASKASEMLGITKQAFSKDQRIKNRFIIQCKIEGDEKKVFYYIPSVTRYRQNRDGRFILDDSIAHTSNASVMICTLVVGSSAVSGSVWRSGYERHHYDNLGGQLISGTHRAHDSNATPKSGSAGEYIELRPRQVN
jgi:hypothetical protein